MATKNLVDCNLAGLGITWPSPKIDLLIRARIVRGEFTWCFHADSAREAMAEHGLTFLADSIGESRTVLAWRDQSMLGQDSPDAPSAGPLGVVTTVFAVQPNEKFGRDVTRLGVLDADGKLVLDEAR